MSYYLSIVLKKDQKCLHCNDTSKTCSCKCHVTHPRICWDVVSQLPAVKSPRQVCWMANTKK